MRLSHEFAPIPAWHGTDRGTFAAFDLAQVAPFNLGLHFGTREAAQSRIDYLRTQDPSGDFRLLRCSLSIRNPFRIDDVFGHSYAGIFSALESALAQLPPSDPRHRTFERLQSRWIAADDNPRFARDPSLHDAFNRRLNVSLRNLFRSLGYDGLVYANEIESPSDSYVIFSPRQVKILATESAAKGKSDRQAA